MTDEKQRDEELKERIARIRDINRRYDDGKIDWTRRVAEHNEIAPGIGDLEHQAGRDWERRR